MLQLWLVLDNPSLLNDVLAAWTEVGARGITILESTGVHRVRSRASRQDVPFMLGLLLTNLALIGNIARVERRLLFVEADALLILLVYLGGMLFLYVKGIG